MLGKAFCCFVMLICLQVACAVQMANYKSNNEEDGLLDVLLKKSIYSRPVHIDSLTTFGKMPKPERASEELFPTTSTIAPRILPPPPPPHPPCPHLKLRGKKIITIEDFASDDL